MNRLDRRHREQADKWTLSPDQWAPFPETNCQQPASMLFAGCWHGDTKVIPAVSRANNLLALVHTGDIGLTLGSGVPTALDALGVPVLTLMGNHDSYALYDLLPVDPANGCRRLGRNIFILPPGFIWEFAGTRFMALHGAKTVDPLGRREGEDLFSEREIHTDSLTDFLVGGFEAMEPVDVVVSHDAPLGLEIPGVPSDPWMGPQLFKEIQANRARIERVVLASGAKTLIHGHYHVNHETTWKHADSSLHTVGLSGSKLLAGVTKGGAIDLDFAVASQMC